MVWAQLWNLIFICCKNQKSESESSSGDTIILTIQKTPWSPVGMKVKEEVNTSFDMEPRGTLGAELEI